MKRRTDLSKISKETFDLAIIGGGITGAGIFQEASRRGYKCVLLEKGDFSSGTSSKSAKLIHGGMRYLRYGKFSLVKESLEERNYLLKNYPHLVFPLPFVFPMYSSKLKYHVGLAIYQFLGKGNNLPEYQSLDKKETIKKIPFINSEKLEGSFIYFDANSNDSRLCNEVIHSTAQIFPSSIPINYCEVTSCDVSRATVHLKCKDHIKEADLSIHANYIINATGVWTDGMLKKLTSKKEKVSAPSKGVHVILDHKRFPMHNAVILPSYAGDERLLYGLPWENDSYIIGTTDTEFSGNPEKVKADKADIDYLLNSINHFAPSLKITEDDVLYAYAGLRPLVHEEKESKARSRDYQIWWSGEKILSIFGGKLTSFHSMATSLLNEFEKKTGKKKSPANPKKKALNLPQLDQEMITNILAKYAEQAVYVLNIGCENQEFCKLLDEEVKIYLAEVVYFIRHQQCYHLDDLLFRRLSLGYVLRKYKNRETIIRQVAEIMKEECGWLEKESANEIERITETIGLKSNV